VQLRVPLKRGDIAPDRRFDRVGVPSYDESTETFRIAVE
jgi:hypothetical protein